MYIVLDLPQAYIKSNYIWKNIFIFPLHFYNTYSVFRGCRFHSCVCVLIRWSGRRCAGMRARSSSDIPRVQHVQPLRQPPPAGRSLIQGSCCPTWVQTPCTSLIGVYSIPVTLCFISGHEDNHGAAFPDPLVVPLTVTQGHSHCGQFTSEALQQLRKKVHEQTAPVCYVGTHGPHFRTTED